MKHYGLKVPEGSEVTNLTAPGGTSFPAGENAGELFFRTDENKLYVYTTSWTDITGAGGGGSLGGLSDVDLTGSPGPATNDVLTYDGVNWVHQASSGGGLNNVVEDTTPQLGGDLDVNTNNIVSVGGNNIDVVASQGSTSVGGAISITSGDGAGGNYAGGNVNITAGDGSSLGYGGDITITTGDGYKSGDFNVVVPTANGYIGGSVDIRAGDGFAGYAGGSMSLFAGDGYQGGTVEIRGGNAVNGTTPGSISLVSGGSSFAGSTGAVINITGGAGVSAGGDTALQAGNSTGSGGTPGDVELRPGYDQDTPANAGGNVIIRNTHTSAPPPQLRFSDTDNSAYVALAASGTIASSFSLTLPVDVGSNGQVLTTDGGNPATLSWTSSSSGTLAALSDVDLTGSPGPAANDVLTYDGVNWVHQASQGGADAWDVNTASTASFSALTTYDLLLVDASSNNVTINLHDAASSRDRPLVLKRIDSSANTVTVQGVAGSPAQTIDGQSSVTIDNQYDALTIMNDTASSVWYIL